MKKKALLLTSIGAVFLVGISAVTISGIGQLNKLNTPVKASPTEYSVTFDAESNIETVDDGVYAMYETTPRGAKVGVVGFDNSEAYFTFKGASFMFIWLYGYNELKEVGAFEFSTITGFAISFSGGSVSFDGGVDSRLNSVVSEQEYKGLSITPSDYPEFITTHSITVSSLTIWYTC